jgi:hypothetical protein
MSSTTGAGSRSRNDVVQPVVRLLLLNLGLSILLAVLTVVFRQQLIDYQFAHYPGAATATPDKQDDIRHTLNLVTWMRPASVLIISLLYLSLLKGLRAGKRRSFLRLRILTLASLAAIVYLLIANQSPLWVQIEQVVQGVVLILLGFTALRPQVRAHFS